jgi:membrane protein DedA with SNARE-associated domain
MIWIAVVGLAVGVLLAQRFKIVVLLPGTVAIAIVALAVATTQASSASSTVLIMGVTTVGMQVGYFVGMLARRGTGRATRSPSFSQTTSVRDSAR